MRGLLRSAVDRYRTAKTLRALDLEGFVDGPDAGSSLYFDVGYYTGVNPDVAASELTPLQHYLLQGRDEGRYPFDPYRTAQHPNLGLSTSRGVSVCLPVYGAAQDTLRCIDSVLACGGYDSFWVCDDGGPDEDLRGALREHAARGRLRLIDHDGENLGFTRSANALMQATGSDDVILLNSDTEVFPGWIEGLRRAAYAGPRVASATALSNNASIASWPIWPAGGVMTTQQARELARALAESEPEEYSLIPTCVGFCVYLRRDALDDIGLFDEEAFPRGYGEENDWSLRGLQRGWVHLLATDVYVLHEGNRSFQGKREALSLAGTSQLQARYPHYLHGIASWISTNPVRPHIPNPAAVLQTADGQSPACFHVLHSYGGGTETAIAQRIQAVEGGPHVLIRMSGSSAAVSVWSAGQGVRSELDLLLDDMSPELFRSWLQDWPAADVVLHDVVSAPEWLHAVLLDLDRQWSVHVHDLGAVCSRRYLVMPSGTPCAGPRTDRCTRCVSLDVNPHAGPSDWRQIHMASWVRGASSVVAPSATAAQLVADWHRVPVQVWPFDGAPGARLMPAGSASALADRPPREPVRVAVLGTLVAHKGSRALAALAEWTYVHEPDLQFHLLGSWEDPVIAAPWPVQISGRYEPGALPLMLDALQPHVILFLSPAAETFSMTYSEAQAFAERTGAAVVAPSGGVFEERADVSVTLYPPTLSVADLGQLLLETGSR